MKVTISEVNGPLEAIFAAGLKEILVIDGVTVDCPSSPGFPPPFPASPKSEAAEAIAPASAAPPVQKSKPGRKAGASKATAKQEVPAPETLRSPSDDAPRLTIRQRIKNALVFGPQTSRDLATLLNKDGLNTTTELIGQHLYLMTRDKVTKRDDATGTWSLA